MTVNELVQQVRAHPGIAGAEVARLGEDAFAFAVAQAAIPALGDLATEDASTANRYYHMSDPSDVTVTLDANGTADLANLTLTKGILLDKLANGEIRHPDWDFPLSPLRHSGQGALAGNYDSMHAHYWLVGTVIHTRGDGEPLADSDLSFAVPSVPGLDALNVQRATRLVDLVVTRLRGAPVDPERK